MPRPTSCVRTISWLVLANSNITPVAVARKSAGPRSRHQDSAQVASSMIEAEPLSSTRISRRALRWSGATTSQTASSDSSSSRYCCDSATLSGSPASAPRYAARIARNGWLIASTLPTSSRASSSRERSSSARTTSGSTTSRGPVASTYRLTGVMPESADRIRA